MPQEWKEISYFKRLDKLVGVPVINVHIWYTTDSLFVSLCLFYCCCLLFLVVHSVIFKKYDNGMVDDMMQLQLLPFYPKIIDGEIFMLFSVELAGFCMV